MSSGTWKLLQVDAAFEPGYISHSTTYVLLGVAMLASFLAGMLAEQAWASAKRAKWRERNRWRWPRKAQAGSGHGTPLRKVDVAQPPKPPDAADQLRIVLGSTFSTQPLLNKSEARLFEELSRIVPEFNPAWRVMAQVSLGEVLRAPNAEAYRCINSKRVDLLLIDEDCQPRHAIEYQGGAHHQGAAAARDAVKKEALRRAGVGYHEVVAGQTTPSDLRRLVERLTVTKVSPG